MTTVTLRGNPIALEGQFVQPGQKAPLLQLTGGDLKEVTLADFAGKKKILNIVPSLDTPVCATSTKKFNEEAAKLENTVVLVISADLPFAQKRFCATEGIANVVALSAFRSAFSGDWGVKIKDGPMAGLCARAVVVLDAQDIVRHAELVPEIAQEPDYPKAISAARSL